MAYSDFTLQSAKDRFEIRLQEMEILFRDVQPVPSSAFLRTALRRGMALAFGNSSGKARSEGMVVPLLLKLKEPMAERINVFSGVQLRVHPEQGPDGFCDYLITGEADAAVLV